MFELTFLVGLLIAHIVGDFYVQPASWVSDKRERGFRSWYLLFHAILHATLTLIVALFFLSDGGLMLLWLPLLVGISHYIIDLVKAYLPEQKRYFLIDQFLHVLILTILWLTATEQFQDIPYIVGNIDGYSVTILILAFLLVMKPAAILIAMLLKPLIVQLKEEDSGRNSGSLDNAGKMIGIYERIIVLALILLQQYGAIGFVLAAKSVFRFGDLRDAHSRSRTEYVLLGTFVSLAVVLIIGMLASYLLKFS